MVKKAKPAERKQRLKVFRTPIGFHDAFVAAPSQKAALEAWGVDANIFAQGLAEEVTDPKLIEEPLANPGKVFKKVRGSADDHFAELDRAPSRKKKAAEDAKIVELKPRTKAKPKPSRDDLDAAEQALEKAEKKQRKELRKLDEKKEALERDRRDLQRRHEADRDKLTERCHSARIAFERAMRAWERS